MTYFLFFFIFCTYYAQSAEQSKEIDSKPVVIQISHAHYVDFKKSTSSTRHALTTLSDRVREQVMQEKTISVHLPKNTTAMNNLAQAIGTYNNNFAALHELESQQVAALTTINRNLLTIHKKLDETNAQTIEHNEILKYSSTARTGDINRLCDALSSTNSETNALDQRINQHLDGFSAIPKEGNTVLTHLTTTLNSTISQTKLLGQHINTQNKATQEIHATFMTSIQSIMSEHSANMYAAHDIQIHALSSLQESIDTLTKTTIESNKNNLKKKKRSFRFWKRKKKIVEQKPLVH